MGCEETLTSPVFTYKETGEKFYRCPVKLVSEEAWQMLSMYSHYKNGYLPFSGGIFEQSEWFLQRIELLRGYEAKMMEEYNPKGTK